MPNRLAARAEVTIGEAAVLDTMSQDRRWYVIFEGDAETAYLYAVDRSGEAQSIRGVLHVYNVGANRGTAVTADLVWATDDAAVALSIDGVPQAAFDFVGMRSTCLTGAGGGPDLAPPDEWDESVVAVFYA